MVRKWGAAAVLMGVLAGCSSATDGQGAPQAGPGSSTQGLPVPGSSAQGLPVPVEPTATGPTTTPTTPPATPPATTSAPTTPAPTPAPTTGPAGRGCPADVIRTLPGARSATLVAGFGTTRFRLYFCRTDRGQLYYRGISRAAPKQATTIPATTIPGGYQARKVFEGDTYVYRVTPARLVVTKNGKPLFTDRVTSTL